MSRPWRSSTSRKLYRGETEHGILLKITDPDGNFKHVTTKNRPVEASFFSYNMQTRTRPGTMDDVTGGKIWYTAGDGAVLFFVDQGSPTMYPTNVLFEGWTAEEFEEDVFTMV